MIWQNGLNFLTYTYSVWYIISMSLRIKINYEVNYKLIFDFMKEKNLDIPKFCKKCDITYAEFGDLLREYEFTDYSVFYKIAEFMKIDICKLIVR